MWWKADVHFFLFGEDAGAWLMFELILGPRWWFQVSNIFGDFTPDP